MAARGRGQFSLCTWAFGKLLAWLHNSQCVDKMLSNNTFLETRIQRLLDGLNFVKKGLDVHVQRLLKKSRVYTLAEIVSKIFVKKPEEKLGS